MNSEIWILSFSKEHTAFSFGIAATAYRRVGAPNFPQARGSVAGLQARRIKGGTQRFLFWQTRHSLEALDDRRIMSHDSFSSAEKEEARLQRSLSRVRGITMCSSF